MEKGVSSTDGQITVAAVKAAWEDCEDENGNLRPDPYPQYRVVKSYVCGCISVESYDSDVLINTCANSEHEWMENLPAVSSERLVEGRIVVEQHYEFPSELTLKS